MKKHTYLEGYKEGYKKGVALGKKKGYEQAIKEISGKNGNELLLRVWREGYRKGILDSKEIADIDQFLEELEHQGLQKVKEFRKKRN